MIPARNIIRPIAGYNNHQNPINKLLLKTQVRYSFDNKYRHGPTKLSNPSTDYVQLAKEFFTKEGMKFTISEMKRFVNLKRFSDEKVYTPGELCIFEHFDSEECIKRWKPVADSDSLNGFSHSNISISKAGHALFHGILDNRLPDDGVTQASGHAGIIGPRRPRTSPFAVEASWDWERFNTIEIRFRGDGRKYTFIVNTATWRDDLAYYDAVGHPLYTRGGPYWQTYRIPFSKFIYASKGFIQDKQGSFPTFLPKFVAITLQDSYDGPFSLEIDYIALLYEQRPFDEDTAYEGYSHPHIRWIQVNPGCDPPEHNNV